LQHEDYSSKEEDFDFQLEMKRMQILDAVLWENCAVTEIQIENSSI
jgi:hypothetical protein